MELAKGTPREFITAILSSLGVADHYKDYLDEAFQLFSEMYDAKVDQKEIMARFIAATDPDPKFDEIREKVWNYLRNRRSANESAASILKGILERKDPL